MSERSERAMGAAEHRSVMLESSVSEAESMSERTMGIAECEPGAMCEVAW
ncbi:hypothetical protein OH799_09385 [Nocardia sp. NBC_00881]|nr:hypothetical protein OH799_09385 [Nocardia sp. NBC_00881]